MSLNKSSSPRPRNPSREWLGASNRFGSKSEKERPNAPASALKDLLGDLLGDLGVESKIAECQAQMVWEEAVGPALARYARPLRVSRGKLEVAVPSAVWRSQLSFMQNEIVTRINELVGSQVVKELKLINKQDVSKRPNTPRRG